MYYSIGEIAKQTGIAISTLRYYDKEGLFPNIERSNGGIRVFSQAEISALQMVECLKASGLSIKEIRQFMDWCKEGDVTLQNRRDMLYERLEAVQKQMADTQKTMDIITFKCWYYDTALAAGSEKTVKNMPVERMPEEIQKHKRKYFE